MTPFSAWRKTISGRLTIIYVFMFILVLVILNISVYLGLSYFLHNNIQKNLESTTEFISNRLIQYYFYDTDLMEELSRSEQNIYFRILSTNRSIRFQSRFLEGVEMPVVQGYRNFEIGERSFVYTTKFLVDRGIFIGFIQVVRETTTEYKFLQSLLIIMSFTSLVGLAAAFMTGYTITRRTLKPIISITETAKEISGSDISKRLDVSGPEDELTDLARTFNSMLDRLDEAFQRQRQFVSDASHELRTPIAVIQGYANLLDRWGKEEIAVRDEAIEAIRKEAKTMKSLIENLLFLARGDNNKINMRKSEFSLNELVEEVLQETRLITDKLKVSCQRLDQVVIKADRELIKQMLRSFIDNSIKYTPPGGELRLELIRGERYIEIIIEDTGIGIPREELPHIFERFYRVDKSRSVKKGAGLGLSIAKWIIDQHGGEVKVESGPGEGTKVCVLLPLF
ncbi:MAG: HAMP domain-containing protein [Halanaerobiaceae bacterium]|nr:HAMP domain-containing protein [Halanaerobiaceae bacterium]